MAGFCLGPNRRAPCSLAEGCDVEKVAASGALIGASLTQSIPFIGHILGIFGAPVAVFAGAAGGLMLAIISMEPGSRLSRWPGIISLYCVTVFFSGGAIAYWEVLQKIPAGAIGAALGWGLPQALPGLARVVAKAPEMISQRFSKDKEAP